MTSRAYVENFKAIDWSDLKPWTRREVAPPRAMSDLPMPMIISDEMPPTQSMADGRIYDSKRAMSAATRRAGCIEIGNEKMPAFQRKPPARREIKETVERATARFERGERA